MWGVGQPATAQPAAPVHTVFLLGGLAAGDTAALAANLLLLRAQAGPLGARSTLVVLGDEQLLSPALPPTPKRQAAEAQLRQVLAALKDFPGRLVIVPGGPERLRNSGRQHEKPLEDQLTRGDVVLPSGGCPGPVELPLAAGPTLVVLNTAWWLHPDDQPADASACETQDPAAVALQLDDILKHHAGSPLLVVGYHPLLKAGSRLWQEAMPNPRGRVLRRSLLEVLAKYPGLAYASGEAPSLQYHEAQGLHHLGSGAAAACRPVPARTGEFVAPAPGFARLDYAADGAVQASFWSAASADKAGQQLYTTSWPAPAAPPPSSPPTPLDFSNQTAVVQASTQYEAGRFRRWLQGGNYRREWQQPVRVPVLDLSHAEGGLTPLKRGGGLQTKTLRLRAATGQEFVLRSVEKNTNASVPAFLRHTLAAAIVQDQISASHPYAALAVPPLAEAAGVGHTNPQLVLVPDDPRLGDYRAEFAGTLALLEARDPAPPRSFGGRPSNKKYGTADVLKQLQASNRSRVDQRALLRARLLDMVLADWDRHDDQWRWLAYPRPGGGQLLRAVPRDRDQAFFVNEGFLPHRASVEYLLPRIQGFDYRFHNVNSFNYNARYFDRTFLTELSQADWRALADSVQASLTDAVLAQALRQWPDSIYRLSGPTVLAKLKAHRDQLPAWAAQYYRFLARTVDVAGSDEREYFEVVRDADDRTRVAMYALGPGGQRGALLYQRTFLAAETQEIRLYGQGGADVFVLSGHSQRGPLVRVVGGAGLDSLLDRSVVAVGPRKTKVYDVPAGMQVGRGPETALRLSNQVPLNQYNRTAFQYAYTAPSYPISYNADDGLFIGAGLVLRRPGFGKLPWATTQLLTGNVALRTLAFSFGYEGTFTHLVGPFDLLLHATVQAPNYVRNFYGLGNNTTLADGQDPRSHYYRVRFRNITASALLRRALSPRLHVFGGPLYQAAEVEDTPGRVLSQLADERLHPATLFAAKHYGGLQLGYELRSPGARDLFPQGVHWLTELTALRPLNEAARPLTRLTSDLMLYRSFQLPVRLTLAARVGGAFNLGEYEFFQAATLGGLSNLRGYGRTRFAGRQSAYNNLEARVQLGSFRSYLFPASFGVLGFHDVGRVWQPGEASRTWHRGYGGGVWLAPTPQVVLAAMYGFSAEDSLPLIRLGYFF